MKIVEIKKQDNDAHNNQTTDYKISIPDGWAVVPDDMETPNFPYGEVEVEEIDGVMTVTKWVAGVIPEPEPIPEPIPEPSDIDDFANAILEGVNEV